VAGAAPHGLLSHPLAGLLASLAAIGLALWLGGRIMSRAALRGGVGTRVRSRANASRSGPFAKPWPGLTPVQSLLATRELVYMSRTPAILYQMLVMPLMLTGIVLIGRHREAGFGEFLPLFIMTSTLSTRNLMLWAHDGAGIRTLFLLPFTSRDLVLSKNAAWLSGALFETAFAFTVIGVVRRAQVLPLLPSMITGYLAVVFVAASLGTWVSITKPKKAITVGLSRRGPGGVVGFGIYLAILLVAGAVTFGVFVVRKLAPAAAVGPASLAFTMLALVACIAIWWLSMSRHADELERQREKLIEELAKSTED
jgi:hypothetical protein